MQITGTCFNYFQVCHRKLWLFANGITMEHNSDAVEEGKLLHEKSYPQRSTQYEEVAIDGIKVDFFDSRNRVIHELKKSNKIEAAHEWQLKYYLYVFQQNGIVNCTGILEYPALRRTKKVKLEEDDICELQRMMGEIETIIAEEHCPLIKRRGFCRNCSYFDFCYSEEERE